MKKLLTIGEALIDFIPDKCDKLKNITNFKKTCGGAPANVASIYSILGGTSTILTKLGDDPFGHFIIDELAKLNVETKYIKLDKNYDTSLAFVSLTKDGNRDFKFYRRTAADLMYSLADLPTNLLDIMDIVHFCSIDLIQSPMKESTRKILEIANENKKIVSFDPNLRFELWNNLNDLKNTILDFLNYTNILKISDEELEFITDNIDILEASKLLFNKYNNLQIILYSMGKEGSMLITKDKIIRSEKFIVEALDTTAAGDSFIAAFLYYYLNLEYDLEDSLNKATKFASTATTLSGGIMKFKKILEQ